MFVLVVFFCYYLLLVYRAKLERSIELTASTPYYGPELEIAQADAIWS